jgi:nitroimidazol reductase NimA-like FMN-containing flavoprotein (pyridoxamine 5'-phosphate oxidase superfamily)
METTTDVAGRDLDEPCLVGAANATRTLHDGGPVAVDGGRGTVDPAAPVLAAGGAPVVSAAPAAVAGDRVPRLDHAGLEILDDDACLALIRSAAVARIGFVVDDEPVVFPVNIGWWEDAIVFSTERGSKLDAAVGRRPVAVEIDEWDVEARTGWSVMAKGVASVVVDGREIDALDRLSVRSFVRPTRPKHWVTVRITAVSGRRAGGSPPGPRELGAVEQVEPAESRPVRRFTPAGLPGRSQRGGSA